MATSRSHPMVFRFGRTVTSALPSDTVIEQVAWTHSANSRNGLPSPRCLPHPRILRPTRVSAGSRYEDSSLQVPVHRSVLLPTRYFHAAGFRMVSAKDLTEEQRRCPICLEYHEGDSKLIQIPCNEPGSSTEWKHVLCLDCTSKWFCGNLACPQCRKKVPLLWYCSSDS